MLSTTSVACNDQPLFAGGASNAFGALHQHSAACEYPSIRSEQARGWAPGAGYELVWVEGTGCVAPKIRCAKLIAWPSLSLPGCSKRAGGGEVAR